MHTQLIQVVVQQTNTHCKATILQLKKRMLAARNPGLPLSEICPPVIFCPLLASLPQCKLQRGIHQVCLDHSDMPGSKGMWVPNTVCD